MTWNSVFPNHFHHFCRSPLSKWIQSDFGLGHLHILSKLLWVKHFGMACVSANRNRTATTPANSTFRYFSHHLSAYKMTHCHHCLSPGFMSVESNKYADVIKWRIYFTTTDVWNARCFWWCILSMWMVMLTTGCWFDCCLSVCASSPAIHSVCVQTCGCTCISLFVIVTGENVVAP